MGGSQGEAMLEPRGKSSNHHCPFQRGNPQGTRTLRPLSKAKGLHVEQLLLSPPGGHLSPAVRVWHELKVERGGKIDVMQKKIPLHLSLKRRTSRKRDGYVTVMHTVKPRWFESLWWDWYASWYIQDAFRARYKNMYIKKHTNGCVKVPLNALKCLFLSRWNVSH